MAGDMISLSVRRTAVLPLAGETEVTRNLPTYVVFAKMVVKLLRVGEQQPTV